MKKVAVRVTLLCFIHSVTLAQVPGRELTRVSPEDLAGSAIVGACQSDELLTPWLGPREARLTRVDSGGTLVDSVALLAGTTSDGGMAWNPNLNVVWFVLKQSDERRFIANLNRGIVTTTTWELTPGQGGGLTYNPILRQIWITEPSIPGGSIDQIGIYNEDGSRAGAPLHLPDRELRGLSRGGKCYFVHYVDEGRPNVDVIFRGEPWENFALSEVGFDIAYDEWAGVPALWLTTGRDEVVIYEAPFPTPEDIGNTLRVVKQDDGMLVDWEETDEVVFFYNLYHSEDKSIWSEAIEVDSPTTTRGPLTGLPTLEFYKVTGMSCQEGP